MKLSPNEYHDYISGFANIFLFLGAVLLLVYSVAPLFGGKFSIRAFIYYGAWIIFAICGKVEAKRIKQKNVKDTEFIILSIIELACIVVWLPYPYNLVSIPIFIFLKYFGYKAMVKTINEENCTTCHSSR